jgi:hypothetical protein
MNYVIDLGKRGKIFFEAPDKITAKAGTLPEQTLVAWGQQQLQFGLTRYHPTAWHIADEIADNVLGLVLQDEPEMPSVKGRIY